MSEQERAALLVRLAGPRPAVPPEREARVRAAVHTAWCRSQRARRRRVQLGIAGSLLAMAATASLTLLVWPPTPTPPTGGASPFARVERADAGAGWRTGEHVALGAWVESGTGGLALRSPSGLSLRLAPGSRLRPLAPGRVRLERGAVYVDSRTFGLVVETPLAVLTDVGTQFEVRLAGAALAVRVREGRVRVAASQHVWEAAAGDEVRLERDAVRQLRIAPDAASWAWVEALAEPPRIEGEPLLALLEWVARERGLRLAFADGEAARQAATLRLHGDLAGLSVGEALEAVLATTGFEADARAGELVVRGSAPPRR